MSMPIPANRKLALATLAVGISGLALGLLLYRVLPSPGAERPDIPGLLWPDPKPLSAFHLTDHHGQPFGLDRLEGKWTFLFFGYTHCPDVCPMALSVLANVDKRLHGSGDATHVQYVFVSVDPQRDTLAHLADYVTYFDKSLIGATAPEKELSLLTRQLGILYTRTEPDARGDYLVDHTASILLVDPKARLVAVFSTPHDATTIASRFSRIRHFVGG